MKIALPRWRALVHSVFAWRTAIFGFLRNGSVSRLAPFSSINVVRVVRRVPEDRNALDHSVVNANLSQNSLRTCVAFGSATRHRQNKLLNLICKFNWENVEFTLDK